MGMANDELLERSLERLERFRLLDDTFMQQVFKDDLPLAQHVLRIITGLVDLTLLKMETQRDLKRLAGSHSVMLDVWGEDGEGTQYDLEVQTGDKLEPLRFRYYGSCMDVEALAADTDYSELSQRWLVVVLERDPEGPERALRHYRMCEANGERLGDGTHLLYANAAYRGDDPLGSLMRDFCESDPDKIRDGMLRERVQYFKRTPEGVKEMCRISEEIFNEGMAQGMEQGMAQGLEQGSELRLLDNIRKLVANLGMSVRDALDALEVPEEDRERYLGMLADSHPSA